MTRVLPGVIVTFKDYSVLPEGETNLSVGYVLAAKRGPIGKAELVTSPTDFLNKFTFSGSPTIKDDKTFWSILQVLKYTNQVYVSRAAKNALYGGLVFKANGTTNLNNLARTFTLADGIKNVSDTTKTFETVTFTDDMASFLNATKIEVGGVTYIVESIAVIKDDEEKVTGYKFTLKSDTDMTALVDLADTETVQKHTKVYTTKTGVKVTDPDGFDFADDELFLLTGIDPGAYNNEIRIEILTYKDEAGSKVLKDQFESQEAMVAAEPMLIRVYDKDSASPLEEFLVSKKENAKAFDGSPLYIETVLESSAYIKVKNNEELEGALTTSIEKTAMAGGSDGADLSVEDCVGALGIFEDKTIPVSLIGNGTGVLYENQVYQQALISLATDIRKDCMVFLNTKEQDEKATFNSTKASNIIKYKKEDLGSTSYFGCMYGPHVNYSDVFNSRQVKLGADSTAIAGWLNVILGQGYPFAYAGPQYGSVSGVTTNWKIGDTSGEAENLNDASINYIAYDAKVGRYYMQCQNTLQIANSSLRNIGAVLNILDIKQTFMTFLKEYLQLPITSRLREEILQKCNDYLKTSVLGMGRCTGYTFADVTTDTDLSNNTLRYVLSISLTPYAQKIYLDMNIVPNGFDFTITQGA